MSEAVAASLVLVSAGLCATVTLRSASLRTVAQLTVIALVLAGQILTGRELAEVVLTGGLLVCITAGASSFASELRASSRTDRQAKAAAERRAELLEVVRALPELDMRGAAQAITQALKALGFDGAGVSLIGRGRLVPVDLDGIPPVERLLPLDEGLAGRAVTEGRTVTVANYRTWAARLPDRQHIGSAICTPINADGDVVGVVMGVRASAGTPTDGEVEIAEILAAHLGAKIATQRQLENRQLLVARMDRLDAMRSTFADEVSDELRDPLTLIRGVGHTILTHGDELSPEARMRLLDRLCGRTEELREVVDALLDFSRFQSTHRDPELRVVTLAELFGPHGAHVTFDATVHLDVEVEVDVALVRHAIDLLLDDRSGWVAAATDDREVTLTFHLDADDRHALVRSLVEQVAVEAGGTARFKEQPQLVLPRSGRVVGTRVVGARS